MNVHPITGAEVVKPVEGVIRCVVDDYVERRAVRVAHHCAEPPILRVVVDREDRGVPVSAFSGGPDLDGKEVTSTHAFRTNSRMNIRTRPQ